MIKIIKIIGGILTIIPMYIYGSYLGNKGVYKLKDYKEIRKGLILLESEIKYNKELLHIACKKISLRMENPISEIFFSFGKRLENEIYKETKDLWNQSVDDFKNKLYFNNYEIEEIKRFGNILGNNDKDVQLENIKLLIDYISNQTDEISKESYKTVKLYKSISLLGGVLIVIILL